MRPEEQLAFGDLLRQYRHAAELTQEELAGRAGMTAKALSLLEGGRRHPRRDTLQRLAKALNLSDIHRSAFMAAARGTASHESRLVPTQVPSLSTPETSAPLLALEAEGRLLVRVFERLETIKQQRQVEERLTWADLCKLCQHITVSFIR